METRPGGEIYKSRASTKEETIIKVATVAKPGISWEEHQSYYSHWAVDYEHDVGLVIDYKAPEIIVDHLAEYLADRKDARILDACAGTGRCGTRLHKLGYTNLTALDGNAQMLEEAKKKNIYNDFIHAFMGNVRLPCPDDSFDALCISGAFFEGHLKPDCLIELIRIVKPGGYIVFGLPELHLITVEAYRNKLEPEMKFLEDKGLWKMMLRKIVPLYTGLNTPGIVYCFQPQEGKRIIGTGKAQ